MIEDDHAGDGRLGEIRVGDFGLFDELAVQVGDDLGERLAAVDQAPGTPAERLGRVDGGPATVLAALRTVLGPKATIVVPAQTPANSTTSSAAAGVTRAPASSNPR